MLAPMAHFSLCEITDSTKHAEYNEAFQLTLLPEILKLPGVAWAERWVRPPKSAAAASGEDAAIATAQYGELVLFHPPVEAGIRLWRDAAERVAQIGHLPKHPWMQTRLQGFFVPVKGYVAPRVLISAPVLPFRPARGLFVILSRFSRHDAETEAVFRWYDEIRIPDLLSCQGAVGAWTLVTEALFQPERDLRAPALRIVMVWLDDDPLAFVAELRARAPAWRRDGRLRDNSSVEQMLFAGPLLTITPWQWDWFDAAASA